MFFLKMISRSFSRQFKRRLLIAVTVCLSATVSVAMLGVVFDVGDKLNAELSTYGSNIVVQPKSDAVVSDLYNTGDSAGSASGSSSGSDGGSTSDGSAAADSADAAVPLGSRAAALYEDFAGAGSAARPTTISRSPRASAPRAAAISRMV